MSGQPQPGGLRSAVILLFKSAPPFVLYPENPEGVYEEFKGVIRNAKPTAPKLIEKPGNGPIRRLAFIDTELIGVSLQAGTMPNIPG